MKQNPTEYDLAIDTQAEKFLELKQKLTYFLVTASVAPIAFAISFAKDEIDRPGPGWFFLALGLSGLSCGLLSAGTALLSLHRELKSYRKHIQYRYARKSWEELTKEDQEEWDRLNKSAAFFLKVSFGMLFLEITQLVVCIVAILMIHRPSVGLPSGEFRLWH